MNKSVEKEIKRLLYPDNLKCVVCGREIHPNRYGLCDECTFDINENFCLRCGRHKVGMGDYCNECSKHSLYFDEARSSVSYDGNAKSIVRRLKYGSAKYLAYTIVEYMLDTLFMSDWDFDCFTYVPMHKKRERKRGYNQAKVLAEELASRTTTPCIDLLAKIKYTQNQARLDKSARESNLAGSFATITTAPKHVVLIDDVMTTGSTVNECAKMLKAAGATVVYVLTFASVPERPVLDTPTTNLRNFNI